MRSMKMTYILPLTFGLGLAATGGMLLSKALKLELSDGIQSGEQTTMLLKGGGLALVGVLMLIALIVKSGLFRKR